MTRQRCWQLKRIAAGLCRVCGEPRKGGYWTTEHCAVCRRDQLEKRAQHRASK